MIFQGVNKYLEESNYEKKKPSSSPVMIEPARGSYESKIK